MQRGASDIPSDLHSDLQNIRSTKNSQCSLEKTINYAPGIDSPAADRRHVHL